VSADEEESQGRKRVVVFDDDLELAAAVREGLQSLAHGCGQLQVALQR